MWRTWRKVNFFLVYKSKELNFSTPMKMIANLSFLSFLLKFHVFVFLCFCLSVEELQKVLLEQIDFRRRLEQEFHALKGTSPFPVFRKLFYSTYQYLYQGFTLLYSHLYPACSVQSSMLYPFFSR